MVTKIPAGRIEVVPCNPRKFPGVVLISGGDQEAFREWYERWTYKTEAYAYRVDWREIHTRKI